MRGIPGKILREGQKIPVLFRTQIIEAIVISTSGIRERRPDLGIELRTMVKHGLLPQETLTKWMESTGKGFIKLPSGNVAKILRIPGLDNKENFVIEACQWILLSDEYIPLSNQIIKVKSDIHAFYEDAYRRNINLTDEDVVAVDDWILYCAIHLSWNLQWRLKSDPDIDYIAEYCLD